MGAYSFLEDHACPQRCARCVSMIASSPTGSSIISDCRDCRISRVLRDRNRDYFDVSSCCCGKNVPDVATLLLIFYKSLKQGRYLIRTSDSFILLNNYSRDKKFKKDSLYNVIIFTQ